MLKGRHHTGGGWGIMMEGADWRWAGHHAEGGRLEVGGASC